MAGNSATTGQPAQNDDLSSSGSMNRQSSRTNSKLSPKHGGSQAVPHTTRVDQLKPKTKPKIPSSRSVVSGADLDPDTAVSRPASLSASASHAGSTHSSATATATTSPNASASAGEEEEEEDEDGDGGAHYDSHSLSLQELDDRAKDAQEDFSNDDSLFEDAINGLPEATFTDGDPDVCQPAEAYMLRQLLRSVGPREFCLRTVDSGRYTTKKLLTAFGIRAPDFLDEDQDDDANEHAYLSLLTLAISRELSRRAKLLQYNSLDDAVNLLRTSRNIMVITGAGISTSLGIPDFRSKGTGLYAMAERMGLQLSDPQEAFDIHMFREDPTVFYTVAKEIVVKINRHSPTHAFIAMLDRMGKLLTNYTQNIDNIEGLAGVSPDRTIQCHGSFATATCLRCGYRCDGDDIFPDIRARRIPRCPECLKRHQQEQQQQQQQQHQKRNHKSSRTSLLKRKRSDNNSDAITTTTTTTTTTGATSPSSSSTPSSAASSTSAAAPRKRRRKRKNAYGFDLDDDDDESDDDNDALAADSAAFDHPAGIMKPDIIFFGEGLPDAFGDRLAHHDRDKVDLVLVIGTSMKVNPVSEIPAWLPPHVPQICISLEPITHINFDIDLVGECDVVVAELCRRAGWPLRHDMVPQDQVVRIESEPGFPHRHRFTQVYPPKLPKEEDPVDEEEDEVKEEKAEEVEEVKEGRNRRVTRTNESPHD